MKEIIETKVNFLDEKSFSPYGEVIGFKEKEPEISDNDLAYWPSISEIKLSNDVGQISLLELKRKRQFVCDNFEITTTSIDDGSVGKYTSLAIDSLGFPIISYYNELNNGIKIAWGE